jgi:Spy/CpxP family protein refolding chaperone
MLRKTLTLSLILTMTVFLGLAYGEGYCGAGHQEGPGGMMLLGCAKEIGLEEAQIDKIKSIHLSSEKEVIKLRADLQISRLELRELMSSDNPDKAKVNKKIDELSQLRAKIQKIEAGTRIDVISLLTPEQKQSFKEYRMKRMKEAPGGWRPCQDRRGYGASGMGMGRMEGAPGWRLSPPPTPAAPPEPE